MALNNNEENKNKVYLVYTGQGRGCGHVGIFSTFLNAEKAIHEKEPNLDTDFRRGIEKDGSTYFFNNKTIFFYEIFETELDKIIDWNTRY